MIPDSGLPEAKFQRFKVPHGITEPSYTLDLNAFLPGINFSTPGCGEVSGHFETDDLTFMVWVVK